MMNPTERICWLSLGIVVFAALIATQVYQQEAIERILETQGHMLKDYDTLARKVSKTRAECASVWSLDADVRRVEYQMDIVTAASRSGWDDAHRLIRSGALED